MQLLKVMDVNVRPICGQNVWNPVVEIEVFHTNLAGESFRQRTTQKIN